MSGKTFCIWRDRWQFIRQFTRYNWYVGELRPIDFAPDGRGQTRRSALYVRANTSVCPLRQGKHIGLPLRHVYINRKFTGGIFSRFLKRLIR
ncbi:MAG: hypothetical protein HC769_10370 [Cyanobacteria bacterium CRU_2_1]|nr:hypothetical protein [Cyanobacteria bacterium CRU_2_1]